MEHGCDLPPAVDFAQPDLSACHETEKEDNGRIFARQRALRFYAAPKFLVEPFNRVRGSQRLPLSSGEGEECEQLLAAGRFERRRRNHRVCGSSSAGGNACKHIRAMTDAYRVFRALEQHLNEALPRPREVATNIADIVRTSKKVIGASAQAVVRRWKSANPTVSSYPDLALRAPCPYRTVFEGKYFSRSGLTSAETALATNIYQTFFYRGLAKIAGGRAVLRLRVCLRARVRRYFRWVDAPGLGRAPPEDWERMLGGSGHLRDDPSRTEVEASVKGLGWSLVRGGNLYGRVRIRRG